jgi:hypothetical protein
MWKEAAVAKFELLSWNLPESIEESHEEHHSG